MTAARMVDHDPITEPEPVAPHFDGSQPCAQTDPELFFPDNGGTTRPAKKICDGCHFRSPCLEYALTTRLHGLPLAGVWGGKGLGERTRLMRAGITKVSEPSAPPPPGIPVRVEEPVVRLVPAPAPVKPARNDSPTPKRTRPGGPIPHGTRKGYELHRKRKELVPAGDPCGCMKAANEYAAQRRRAQKSTPAKNRPVPVDVGELLAAAQRSPRRAVAAAGAAAIRHLVHLQNAPAADINALTRRLEEALEYLARIERGHR